MLIGNLIAATSWERANNRLGRLWNAPKHLFTFKHNPVHRSGWEENFSRLSLDRLRPQLEGFLSWRMVVSFLSDALRSADGPGCSWSGTARWGDDERIRLQMADFTLRFLTVRQHGGTMMMRATALSAQFAVSRIRKEMTRLRGNSKCKWGVCPAMIVAGFELLSEETRELSVRSEVLRCPDKVSWG